MKKIYNEVLELFVGNNDFQPVFMTPFIIDDKVYASNGNTLAFTDNSLVGCEIKYSKDASKIIKIIPDENRSDIITLDNIKSLLGKIPMVDEVVVEEDRGECKECDGFGVVTWEHGRHEKEDDCPVCDGSGETDVEVKTPTGLKIIDPDCKCRFYDKILTAKNVTTLLKTMNLLNIKEITLISNVNFMMFFKCGDFKIIIAVNNIVDEDQIYYTLD